MSYAGRYVRELTPPLPYIHDEFRVLTTTVKRLLGPQLAAFSAAGGLSFEAEVAHVDNAAIEQYSAANNEYLHNLDRKLKKLKIGPESRKQLQTRLLEFFLESENAIGYYEENYPVIADRIREIKAHKSRTLATDSLLQSVTIGGTREDFQLELLSNVPAIGKQTASTVSYGSVAEWLMLCPLEPKG